jgi:hypothetical protein
MKSERPILNYQPPTPKHFKWWQRMLLMLLLVILIPCYLLFGPRGVDSWFQSTREIFD